MRRRDLALLRWRAGVVRVELRFAGLSDRASLDAGTSGVAGEIVRQHFPAVGLTRYQHSDVTADLGPELRFPAPRRIEDKLLYQCLVASSVLLEYEHRDVWARRRLELDMKPR